MHELRFHLVYFEELGQKNLAYRYCMQVSPFNYRLVGTTIHFPYYDQFRLYEIDAPPRPRYHSRHCITIRMRVEWRRREGEKRRRGGGRKAQPTDGRLRNTNWHGRPPPPLYLSPLCLDLLTSPQEEM